MYPTIFVFRSSRIYYKLISHLLHVLVEQSVVLVNKFIEQRFLGVLIVEQTLCVLDELTIEISLHYGLR